MGLQGTVDYHTDVYAMVVIVVGFQYNLFGSYSKCRMEYSMPFVVIDERDSVKIPLCFPVGIERYEPYILKDPRLIVTFGSGDASTKHIMFDASKLQLFTKDTLVLHPHQTCFLKGSSSKWEFNQ